MDGGDTVRMSRVGPTLIAVLMLAGCVGVPYTGDDVTGTYELVCETGIEVICLYSTGRYWQFIASFEDSSLVRTAGEWRLNSENKSIVLMGAFSLEVAATTNDSTGFERFRESMELPLRRWLWGGGPVLMVNEDEGLWLSRVDNGRCPGLPIKAKNEESD